MAKTILQGTVKGMTGERGRRTTSIGLEFGEYVRAVEDTVGWRCIVETPSVVPQRPSRLWD